MENLYIYVMQMSTGPIKIGISDNVLRRLREIRQAQPYSVSCLHQQSGTLQDEISLMRQLAFANISGEWFEDSPETRAIINKYMGRDLRYLTVIMPHEHGQRAKMKPQPARQSRGRIKWVKRRLADGSIKKYAYDVDTRQRLENAENVNL